MTHNDWANCFLRSGSDLRGAEAHYRKAVAYFAESAKMRPKEFLFGDWHSRSLGNLGLLCLETGGFAEATDLTRQSVSVARRLAKDFSGELDARECLAVALTNDGTVDLQRKEPASAVAKFSEALALYEGLERQLPVSLEFRWGRAMSESNLGAALALGPTASRERAAKCFAHAAALYEELVRTHPDNKELLRMALPATTYCLSIAYVLSDR
jgi:hypothetical protein